MTAVISDTLIVRVTYLLTLLNTHWLLSGGRYWGRKKMPGLTIVEHFLVHVRPYGSNTFRILMEMHAITMVHSTVMIWIALAQLRCLQDCNLESLPTTLSDCRVSAVVLKRSCLTDYAALTSVVELLQLVFSVAESLATPRRISLTSTPQSARDHAVRFVLHSWFSFRRDLTDEFKMPNCFSTHRSSLTFELLKVSLFLQ